MKRKALSARIRFEVLKRDKFTCQYCGKKAPDVVLAVDHIKPVASGGTNDPLNLATSCVECNGGKSDKPLSDESAVEKARHQTDLMAQRREQIQMMAKWQIELATMDPEIAAINELLSKLIGQTLSEVGEKNMRRRITRYGLVEVMQSTALAFSQYDRETAWEKITPILAARKRDRDFPGTSDAWHIVHNLKRTLRGSAWHPKEAVELLLRAKRLGVDWQDRSRQAEGHCRATSTSSAIASTTVTGKPVCSAQRCCGP